MVDPKELNMLIVIHSYNDTFNWHLWVGIFQVRDNGIAMELIKDKKWNHIPGQICQKGGLQEVLKGFCQLVIACAAYLC